MSDSAEQPATIPSPRLPWEQQPDEPNAVYVRFLTYRSLGPCRTIPRAAKIMMATKPKPTGKNRKKPERGVGVQEWYNNSSDWNWKERAERWDIDRLNDAAERVESAISELIIRLSQKATEALDTDVLPKTFSDVLHAFKELSPHVPQNAGSIGQSDRTLPAADETPNKSARAS